MTENIEEKFKHYAQYLVAKLKRKIKEAQSSRNCSSRPEDSAYKMGYLMALYHVIDDMKSWSRDFDIENEDIGLQYDVTEIVINLLMNLSYISENLYQKRIKFEETKDYEGEFNQLNDYILDQCETILALAKFEEKYQTLLMKFYAHIEPYYQDYDALYDDQKKQSWEELVEIAKEILIAFEFDRNSELLKNELKVDLSKNEYEYLSQASFLPKRFKKMYFSNTEIKNSYPLKIHSLWADEIKNLCQIQLQTVHPKDQKTLEILIDKFYVGFFL